MQQSKKSGGPGMVLPEGLLPPSQPQEPFMKVYLCPECGYWLVTNTIMECLAALAGPVKRICPHDNTELAHVKPEDRLQFRKLGAGANAVE